MNLASRAMFLWYLIYNCQLMSSWMSVEIFFIILHHVWHKVKIRSDLMLITKNEPWLGTNFQKWIMYKNYNVNNAIAYDTSWHCMYCGHCRQDEHQKKSDLNDMKIQSYLSFSRPSKWHILSATSFQCLLDELKYVLKWQPASFAWVFG